MAFLKRRKKKDPPSGNGSSGSRAENAAAEMTSSAAAEAAASTAAGTTVSVAPGAGRTEEPAEKRPAADVRETGSPVMVANLQGLGERSEQQDAFGISILEDYGTKGLFAVLCDGMGGMRDGRAIAVRCVSGVLKAFPYRTEPEELRRFESEVGALNEEIYREYDGSGGATLVAVYLRDGKMWFWSAGDSDILLIRDGRLYPVNEHQEYQVQRLHQAVRDVLSYEDAFHSPQGGALTGFMGAKRLELEKSVRPLVLKSGDLVLLCSDGISDSLSQKAILDAVSVPSPERAMSRLEREVLRASKSGQDNYTAILCRYNGPAGRNSEPEVWIPQV